MCSFQRWSDISAKETFCCILSRIIRASLCCCRYSKCIPNAPKTETMCSRKLAQLYLLLAQQHTICRFLWATWGKFQISTTAQFIILLYTFLMLSPFALVASSYYYTYLIGLDAERDYVTVSAMQPKSNIATSAASRITNICGSKRIPWYIAITEHDECILTRITYGLAW